MLQALQRGQPMISWLFIGLVVTILLTPGPTNTLLASSGIHAGFRKSFYLIPAEALGYLLAISFGNPDWQDFNPSASFTEYPEII